MLARLSSFLASWDPDCERRGAFGSLNAFARQHPDEVAALCALIGAGHGNFGQTFYRHLNRAVIERKAPAIRAFLAALGPLLEARETEAAQAFWRALSADAADMTRARQESGRLRAMWGVTPIVNLAAGVRADRLLGTEAESLVFDYYYISSNFDHVLKEMQEELIAGRYSLIHSFRWLVLGWALLRYDVFHLYNDAGIIDVIGGYGARLGIAIDEMRAYREAGKRLYTYTYGADHRLRRKASAAGRWTFCSDCPEPGKFCVCDDEGGERMLATIRQHATAMISHGLSYAIVHGRSDIPSSSIDLDDIGPPRQPFQGTGPLRVGHFPNHPYFKGTKYLEAAVASLKAEGLGIELVLLSGLPRAQILEAMRGLDVLVDQLVSGSFGTTAMEGMALGLPVICYLHDDVALSDLENCPIIKADPETIEAVLRGLVADRGKLPGPASRGRAYVEKNYSITAWARGMARLYLETGGFPARLGDRIAARAAALDDPSGARAANEGLLARAWQLPLALRAVSRIGRSVVRAKLRSTIAAVKRRTLVLLVETARRRGERRRAGGRVRTLWGTTPILTLPILARCDAMLGLRSDSLVFTTYYITRNFSINLTIPDKIAGKLSRFMWSAHRRFRFAVLAYVMLRYDAVHYFYDHGVLPGLHRFGIEDVEIDLLSRAGLKIYTYAYGADVRTRARTLALGPVNFCTDCPEPGAYCICDDDKLARSLAPLDQRVTARIAMGDMLAYIPGCRNMHYWPLDLERLQPTPITWKPGQPLRIAHAPNHSHFKGTHHLEEALTRLRAEGYDVEMVKISGVPNATVLEMFRSVSLVADQFIGGFHGYTALEAMALGRPVLCFLRDPTMTIAPEETPIINTPPQLVHATLKSILDGEFDLQDLGMRSRRFVERHYAIGAVAARLGRLYVDTSGWPAGLLAAITARVDALEAELPPAICGPAPVAWDRVARASGADMQAQG
ncbi:hypothetical protein [Bosea sp. (in: a-proteobacteria)]|uniref:glycosyltransferase n=1 Tax=Bosea sp. (in: a-proteobacteria) TaxID=1871050 RepID=UPI00261F77D0|nr:hypothetical protein [Bosea sp. (in: a-proteobacteria)]MCO5090662.1 hypothetical protein [Bosea sp. (in: a-proteobacteria)]